MSDIKHTPGPWTITSWATGAVNGPHDRMVASVYGDHADCQRDERQDANARLIAAAPDLLEALRKVRDWMDDPVENMRCPVDMELASAIRIAVAKAEGRSTP